jgi:RecB family exonuclease
VRRDLGPYFGWAGRGAAREPLAVTRLERFAVCPWQVFLTRVLKLEPTPDPLAALPGLDPLLLGILVHRALERTAAGGAAEAVLRAEAERLLFEERILLPGLARALVERAQPYLEAAQKAEEAEGSPEVIGVEVEGSVKVEAGDEAVTIRFTADRLDRLGGVLRYTDYKTGKLLSEHRRPEKRRASLLAAVRAGTHLQAAAYVLGTSEPADARYLYLRPDVANPEARELAVRRDDGDLLSAFSAAAQTVVRGFRQGAFVPRVVDPSGRKEPVACTYCTVAQACIRGDSGARKRLIDWAERARETPPARGDERALLGVWDLPALTPNPSPSLPTDLPGQGNKE